MKGGFRKSRMIIGKVILFRRTTQEENVRRRLNRMQRHHLTKRRKKTFNFLYVYLKDFDRERILVLYFHGCSFLLKMCVCLSVSLSLVSWILSPFDSFSVTFLLLHFLTLYVFSLVLNRFLLVFSLSSSLVLLLRLDSISRIDCIHRRFSQKSRKTASFLSSSVCKTRRIHWTRGRQDKGKEDWKSLTFLLFQETDWERLQLLLYRKWTQLTLLPLQSFS